MNALTREFRKKLPAGNALQEYEHFIARARLAQQLDTSLDLRRDICTPWLDLPLDRRINLALELGLIGKVEAVYSTNLDALVMDRARGEGKLRTLAAHVAVERERLGDDAIDYIRASGAAICGQCKQPYRKHRRHGKHAWLRVACDGTCLKL